MVSDPTIPDALTIEAVIVRCSEPDCRWQLALEWDDVKPETGGTDQRAEYQAHYRASHQVEQVAQIKPGTVLVLRGGIADLDADDQLAMAPALIAELTRAAGHQRWALLFLESTVDGADVGLPALLAQVEPAELERAGWIRAAGAGWEDSEHGFIYPNNGFFARCGGPALCDVCKDDALHSIEVGDGAWSTYLENVDDHQERARLVGVVAGRARATPGD